MTYSIASDLWRIAKIEKPPLISSYSSYSDIEEEKDSASGEECYSDIQEEDDLDIQEEILTSSISFLESATTNNQYNFVFGSYIDSSLDRVIGLNTIKLEIGGSTIKIKQIACFLSAFKPEADSHDTSSFQDSSLYFEEETMKFFAQDPISSSHTVAFVFPVDDCFEHLHGVFITSIPAEAEVGSTLSNS